MEIKKFEFKSGKGIYSISKPVSKWSDIRSQANELVKFLDDNNGKFEGRNSLAYALHHSQVEDVPFNFFVIDQQLLKGALRPEKDTIKNYFFPSRVIINPEIIESPEKIVGKIPKRELVKDEAGKVKGTKVVVNDGKVSNKIFIPESCMSFPNRTPKNVERYYRIKVRYQIPRRFLFINYLKTKTEWVDGLKSHIFQHEIDHSKGINMYHKK